ncbi:hypothetical protein GPA23_20400, partial [Aromatoleum aromaticum]|nr:hypothetical protein [Aromatoleum aromaticum]
VARRGRGASVANVPPDLAAVHQGLKRKNVTLALLWEEYVQTAVNADLKLTRFPGGCRFKTDTPLSH